MSAPVPESSAATPAASEGAAVRDDASRDALAALAAALVDAAVEARQRVLESQGRVGMVGSPTTRRRSA